MEDQDYPRPTSEFDMSEIYRITHNERIPGFVLLESERAYLEEYRAAVMKEMQEEQAKQEAEEASEEPVEEVAPKRKYTRKKKVEEPESE